MSCDTQYLEDHGAELIRMAVGNLTGAISNVHIATLIRLTLFTKSDDPLSLK